MCFCSLTLGGKSGIVMQQKHLLCPFHFMLLLDIAVMVSELKNGLLCDTHE